MRPRHAWIFALGVSTAACGSDTTAEAGPVAERIVRGDTTIVRDVSPLGSWGDTMTLEVEGLIGEMEGPPELTFGSIGWVDLLPDGSVLAIDTQAREVRHYDADGRFLRTIGQAGGGPGEYERPYYAYGLPDGRIFLVDGAGRMSVFAADGTFERSWPLPYFRGGSQLTVDTAGHAWVPVALVDPSTPREPGSPLRTAYLKVDPDAGVVDTLPHGGWIATVEDQRALQVNAGDHTKDNFAALRRVAIHPTGHVVRGRTDVYTLELERSAAGSPSILRVERPIEPPRMGEDEHAEWRAYLDFVTERNERLRADALARAPAGAVFPPVAPPYFPEGRVKPPWRNLYLGDDGRLWVHRYTPAVKDPRPAEPRGADEPPPLTWREPNHFDVFEGDGEFLGTVVVPDGYLIRAMRGDTVWGAYYDELQVQYLFRARLVPVRE